MRKRLCLNMIVKNEADRIERCLTSVAPYVDCWVIADTGSTDSTMERIRAFFESRNIPGILVETVFENFGQARNVALDAARDSALEFDHLLLCDADMELVVERPDFRAELHDVAYAIRQEARTLSYRNVRLLPRGLPARYRGATHEYLRVGSAKRVRYDGIWFKDHADGANRPEKFERDIRLLTQSLQDDPDDSRSVLYLANTYFDQRDWENAVRWYERRLEMGGWREELFYASYRIGVCLHRLKRESEMVTRLLDTYERFPHRAEPLNVLAVHYQRKSQHRLAYVWASHGCEIPQPEGNALFVETEVYRWRLLDVKAVSLYWMGRYAEAAQLNRRLLEIVPDSQRARIQENLDFCVEKGG